MSRAREERNRAMLRVRDTLDRDYASELDIAALAELVHLSCDHLIRTFREVYGETPHRYLQRRRVERAMHLLRTGDLDVTDVSWAVGFASLGTFSRTFRAIVGVSPSDYRSESRASETQEDRVVGCFSMAWTRPSSHTSPPSRLATRRSISEKQARTRAG